MQNQDLDVRDNTFEESDPSAVDDLDRAPPTQFQNETRIERTPQGEPEAPPMVFQIKLTFQEYQMIMNEKMRRGIAH